MEVPCKVRKEIKGLKVSKEIQVRKEIKVFKEITELKVTKEIQVSKGQLEILVTLVTLDLKVIKVILGHREILDLQD